MKSETVLARELIIEFEKTSFIPKHWLKILDSIRLIGNVPGAHLVAIPKYKFVKEDALLSLQNTDAFLKAYFSQIIQQATRSA